MANVAQLPHCFFVGIIVFEKYKKVQTRVIIEKSGEKFFPKMKNHVNGLSNGKNTVFIFSCFSSAENSVNAFLKLKKAFDNKKRKIGREITFPIKSNKRLVC
jgi:hypothetical protein